VSTLGLGAADQLTAAPAGRAQRRDGPDTITGGTEDDKLYGDAGYDDLRGGPGNDQLHGGADGDYADYSLSSSAVKVDLKAHSASGEGKDVFDSVENAYGSAYKDTLTGDDEPNIISGFGGNDSIVGAGGADHLSGADGDDCCRDLGNDELGSPAAARSTTRRRAAETVDLRAGLGDRRRQHRLAVLVENVISSSHRTRSPARPTPASSGAAAAATPACSAWRAGSLTARRVPTP
jgi:Ca2+-binding RTX toxin-like protein